MNSLTVDVVTDFVCPWCYVGLTRLDAAIAKLGVPAEIRHHPFFLDPNVPPDGIDVAQMLRTKYGRDPAEMFARVEAEAARSGLPLDLSRQPRQRRTTLAHTLTRAASDKGTQHALAESLFAAHFMESRNIADPEVLMDVAKRHGFTEAEVRSIVADDEAKGRTEAEAAHAAASGIGGVPYFVFNQRLALSGAQPENLFMQAIQQAMSDVPS
jgi:predicted DsbA family dithiol-disulfide isomerase